MPLGQIAALVI